MKYIPGFKYNYFGRYCQVTKNQFQYFKNLEMAIKHPFPLVSIDLDDIQKVTRVNVEIPLKNKLEVVYNQH